MKTKQLHEAEYLLFLYPYGYTDEFQKGVKNGLNFTTTDKGYMAYFNLSVTQNIPMGNDFQMPYNKVKNNEFFAETEETIKLAIKYKKQIIEKYAK